jgi:tetratricopeptide (TPR) repeat protein
LDIHEKAPGPNPLDLACLLADLADLHEEQDEPAQARSLRLRALEITGKPEEPRGWRGFWTPFQARLLKQVGQYDEAESVYKAMLEDMEQHGVPDKSRTWMLKEMAQCCRSAGHEDDAVTYERRAAELEPAQS